MNQIEKFIKNQGETFRKSISFCVLVKEHQIPILGAVGPRADSKWEWSRLNKVYDHRESRNNVNFCYHSSVSENGDASKLTFIIHPAAVKSIRILGRGDSKTATASYRKSSKFIVAEI